MAYVVPPIALPFRVTSGWRVQRSPTHAHQGSDIVPSGRAAIGEPVRAVADSIVTHAVRGGDSASYYARGAEGYGFSGYGRAVALDHAKDDRHSLYAHLERVLVEPGQVVHAGDAIGTLGNTAFTAEDPFRRLERGPHLHWEVATRPYPLPPEEGRIDPWAYLRANNLDLEGRQLPALVRGQLAGVAVARAAPRASGGGSAGVALLAAVALLSLTRGGRRRGRR